MNHLINFAIAEAHDPTSLMDYETRQMWFELEKKIKKLKDNLDKATIRDNMYQAQNYAN